MSIKSGIHRYACDEMIGIVSISRVENRPNGRQN